MPLLVVQPLESLTRDADARSLADALEARSDRASGLSDDTAIVRGEAGTLRVEISGADAVAAVGLLLSLVRTGRWAVGLVVAAPEEPASADTGGEAARDRDLLRRAARSAGRCAVAHDRGGAPADLGLVESALQLLGVLERRRSDQQQEAGRLVEAGASQREAAADLGVTQQAVNDRLRNGLWNETRGLAAEVADLVTRLESRETSRDVTP